MQYGHSCALVMQLAGHTAIQLLVDAGQHTVEHIRAKTVREHTGSKVHKTNTSREV